MTFDTLRHTDIMKQGFAKRLPKAKTGARARIAEIVAVLEGKCGYQSEWAIAGLKEELAVLRATLPRVSFRSAGAVRQR